MASITLYQDNNFQGRALDLDQDVENLNNYGFNDEASSCRIPAGTWMLYGDSDFQGQLSILGKGEYSSPTSMGIDNDSLSSLRHFPDVAGPTILLFMDDGYHGRMVVINGANSDLGNIGFNDECSSIIVLDGKWNLYQDIDFGGTVWEVDAKGGPNGDGRYPLPNPFQNDAISSLRPA